ncbi:MAG TPA: hypothetical protein VLW55_09810 [Burkholderiaceae bacterium]|nr:hypothetical protein [Burkholderiaceae bacterium]
MTELHAAIALAVLTFIFLCSFWLAPGGVLALRRRAGGALQVDVRLAYTPTTLYRLLDAYGPAGRRSFRTMLLADMVFPAIYGATLYLVADLLTHGSAHAGSLGLVARAAAVAAAAFDYAENIFLLHVLRHLDSRSGRSARFAAICTTSKMIAFMVAAAALISAWLGV